MMPNPAFVMAELADLRYLRLRYPYPNSCDYNVFSPIAEYWRIVEDHPIHEYLGTKKGLQLSLLERPNYSTFPARTNPVEVPFRAKIEALGWSIEEDVLHAHEYGDQNH